MNKFYILVSSIFIILLYNKTFSQNENPLPSDSIIKTIDLNKEQWHAWDSIYDYWRKNEFPVSLKKNNLRLSCAHCENIYITVNLFIDNEGKLAKYQVVKENICGSLASASLKNSFLKYFSSLIFPPTLRNINIQAQLGNGLKC